MTGIWRICSSGSVIVVVIGLDDAVYQELVCAVVVLRPGQVALDETASNISPFERARMRDTGRAWSPAQNLSIQIIAVAKLLLR